MKGAAGRPFVPLFFILIGAQAFAQLPHNSVVPIPPTSGETLTGKPIILSQVLTGHPTVLIMGFSKDAGSACTEWARAIHEDPVLRNLPVYEAAMLASAPGFIRGMIKSSIRKGLSAAEQENFVVLTQDPQAWRSYFAVSNDKDAYVVLLDAEGRIHWSGHGLAKEIEPQLRAAAR